MYLDGQNSIGVSVNGWVSLLTGNGGLMPIFSLPLSDAGAGAVSTTPSIATGSPTATTTRATAATTVLSGGLLASVSSGVLRSCYSADGATYLGYFAEGSRTNLCLQSQTFNSATWTKTGVNVVTADQIAAPDGTTTADKEGFSGAGTAGQVYQIVAVTNAVYTYSEYAKAGTTGWIGVGCASDAKTDGAFFNLSTGAVGTVAAGGTATITALPSSWYRGTVARTLTAAGTWAPITEVHSADNQVFNWAAAGTENLYNWGMQLELGTFASSYIPTVAASVVRNADVLSYATSGNTAASMTLALSWTPEAASMGTVFLWGSYVDANNYTAVLHDGTNIVVRRRVAGTSSDATKALTYTAGTTYRIVGRWDATTGTDVWVAGVKGTNSPTTTALQLGATMQIGADGNSANQAFGCLKSVSIYGPGITDSQAAAL